MTPVNVHEPELAISTEKVGRPRARKWLWRPWYAKLWWTAIPIYWLGAVASLKVPLLADFYASALAGFLNILFFPPLTLMVLGRGFARAWIDLSDWHAEFDTNVPDDEFFGPQGRFGGPPPTLDPFDPRSGPLWLGNPLNPLHPTNNIRHR